MTSSRQPTGIFELAVAISRRDPVGDFQRYTFLFSLTLIENHVVFSRCSDSVFVNQQRVTRWSELVSACRQQSIDTFVLASQSTTMKISILAVATVLATTSEAFTTTPLQRTITTSSVRGSVSLQAQRTWWGPAATAVAGWTLASQVSLASVIMPPQEQQQQQQTGTYRSIYR